MFVRAQPFFFAIKTTPKKCLTEWFQSDIIHTSDWMTKNVYE